MNFSTFMPARVSADVVYGILQQDEEWIDNWGAIRRLDQMSDQYIINLHRFLGEKGSGVSIVNYLVDVAMIRTGETYLPRPTFVEMDRYFRATPLWRKVSTLAAEIETRRVLEKARKRRAWFDTTERIDSSW